MSKFIALLRGINVGGKNMIKMAALKTALETAGFSQVETYIQSGNILFLPGDKTLAKLKSRISTEQHLANIISQQSQSDFGLEVPVLVVNAATLQSILENNPWLANPEQFDATHFHVTLFAESKPAIPITVELGTNAIAWGECCLYLHCPDGYSNCKVTNNWLETKLKTTCTTRNWKTLQTLMAMSLNILQ